MRYVLGIVHHSKADFLLATEVDEPRERIGLSAIHAFVQVRDASAMARDFTISCDAFGNHSGESSDRTVIHRSNTASSSRSWSFSNCRCFAGT